MCDYRSLSDQGLIGLHDNVTDVDGTACPSIESELSRRATDFCEALDVKSTAHCRLENWSLQVSRNPRNAGAIVVTGIAYGHRDFPNGTPVVTSPLQVIVRTADAGSSCHPQHGVPVVCHAPRYPCRPAR